MKVCKALVNHHGSQQAPRFPAEVKVTVHENTQISNFVEATNYACGGNMYCDLKIHQVSRQKDRPNNTHEEKAATEAAKTWK